MLKDVNKVSKVTRKLEGEVVSSSMQKTIVVKVNRTFKHPLLKKTVTRSKKYQVHDENMDAGIGDWVEIVESKPISKTKHMVLGRILRIGNREVIL
ncbi:30S ribosomal protein S17, partial [Candidatus Dependentiae bacterium]